MKKFYFLGLMGLGILANAQTPNQTSDKTGTATQKGKHFLYEYEAPSPVRNLTTGETNGSRKFSKAQSGGMINQRIGSTLFVTQTVYSIYRRTMAYSDGKVSATWTTSSDNGVNGYLSRGSGYNTFDGTNWVNSPNSSPRIEPYRTGYPSLNSNGTKEFLISHRVDTSGNSMGLVLNTNSAVGSFSWSTQAAFTPPAQTPSLLWPHSVVSGDYIIVVANYQDSTDSQPNWVYKNGVQSPMVFSRYQISTGQWVDMEKTLPGYDTSLFNDGNSDIYSIDANGPNVAIVCGYYFTDLVMWKSSDNGANWTMKMINQFPVHRYRYDKDSLMPALSVHNGSNHVLVDNSGKAHVFTGLARVQDSILGDGFFTYTYSRVTGGVNDAILYWSEYNPDSSLRIIAAGAPLTVDGDSSIQGESFSNADRRYGISNSTWPSAGIDANGSIYLIYSALTPTDVTTDGSNANYRDIMVTYSSDNGTNWAYPQNASQYLGTNIEQIFPTAARFVDDRVHVTYLSKNMPGQNIAASNTDMFEINYLSIPVSQIMNRKVGIREEAANAVFSIDQNYPNPFHGSTNIDVNFKRSTTATLTIRDIMGKEVHVETFANVPSGNSTLTIRLEQMPAGVYTYTLEADGAKTTQRMIVQ